MLNFAKKIINKLIHKSTYIHREPINKVSLVILILIDIFVLFNVFSGLDNISQWTLSPSEEFPCFSAYERYQTNSKKGSLDVNANTITNLIDQNKSFPYIEVDTSNRLGKVSESCKNYTRLAQAVNNPETLELTNGIARLEREISSLNQEVSILQSQYNSTLLEKIAGQSRQRSINKTSAEQVKSEIDRNKQQISGKQKQIIERQTRLIQNSAADAYLKLLNNTTEYDALKKAYDSAEFWYPNKQILLQTLFLLPLIVIAYLWHSISLRQDRGLQSLLSWHLLLIFCIPLLIKFFEFIQFGNLAAKVIEAIVAVFGGLIFIASYVFILIIPLLGFGLIKFLQIFIFNPRIQAKKRIQKIHCINCNFKLRLSDRFCPDCGFEQYINCSNCQQKTYKFTKFCSTCGHKIEI